MATTFALRATAVKTADKTGNGEQETGEREQGQKKSQSTILHFTLYVLHFNRSEPRKAVSAMNGK